MGGKNSISADGTGKADEVSGTRSATSASDQLVQNLSARRRLQDCRGSAAGVAGTRQEGGFWEAENFQRAVLEGTFQI